MNINHIIKKQTFFIVFAVLMVTITTVGVSYSVFFDVKSSEETQVITAGTLEVTISRNDSKALTPELLSLSEGLNSVPISYTVNNSNSNNLPATFKLYLSVETTGSFDVRKIMISHDGDAKKGLTAKRLAGVFNATDSIEGLEGTSGTYYLIGSGTLSPGTNSTTNYLRIWIDEDIDDDFSGTVKLDLYVVSEVDESQALQ